MSKLIFIPFDIVKNRFRSDTKLLKTKRGLPASAQAHRSVRVKNFTCSTHREAFISAKTLSLNCRIFVERRAQISRSFDLRNCGEWKKGAPSRYLVQSAQSAIIFGVCARFIKNSFRDLAISTILWSAYFFIQFYQKFLRRREKNVFTYGSKDFLFLDLSYFCAGIIFIAHALKDYIYCAWRPETYVRGATTIGDAVVEGFPREAMRAAAAYVLFFAHLIQVNSSFLLPTFSFSISIILPNDHYFYRAANKVSRIIFSHSTVFCADFLYCKYYFSSFTAEGVSLGNQ